MKKYLWFLVTIVFISCNSLSKIERNNIIYTIPEKAVKIVKDKINVLKKFKEEVYVEIEFTEETYILTLIPTSTLDKEIQNLKIEKTGRVLNINWDYYYIIFNTDESLGGYLNSIEDKEENIMNRKNTMSDAAIKLVFDKDWSLK